MRGSLVINEIHVQPVAGSIGFDTDGSLAG